MRLEYIIFVVTKSWKKIYFLAKESWKNTCFCPKRLENSFLVSVATLYQLQGQRKKTRTRVQIKDIKLRFFKKLLLRIKSSYLCFSLQSKTIKKPLSPEWQNFMWLKPVEIALFWLDVSLKTFVFHHMIFLRRGR